MNDNIKVEFRGSPCGGYIVYIDEGHTSHMWSFSDIYNIKLWYKILGEVIAKYGARDTA